MPENKKKVALFATCLVDAFRPSVAAAAVQLLQAAGLKVTVPKTATCCGQVSHNSGDIKGARELAQHHIDLLLPFDYVVVPSGSCTGMIKNQYPVLFDAGSGRRAKAEELAGKTYELTAFLARHGKKQGVRKTAIKKIAIHDSCSCLRELGIREEPRQMLAGLDGAEVVELSRPERCCGFGGLFSLKFSEISNHLADQKIETVKATGANVLVGADLGCLLNLEARLKKDGHPIEVRHITEVLAEALAEDRTGEG